MSRRAWGILLAAWAAAAGGHAAEPVARVAFEGNVHAGAAELQAAIAVKPGGPASSADLESARRMLQDKYAGLGRLDARIDAVLERREEGLIVTFRIEEGPLYTFGPTRVEGLRRLHTRVIHRELTYREGEPFDPSELLRSRRALYSLGLFHDVQVDTAPVPGTAVGVRVAVEERPAQWLRGGVGYGSEEQERGVLSYVNQNLFRRAYRFEASFTASALWREAQAEVLNRYFFGTRTEHRMSAGWRRENRESYDFERIQARTSLGRRLAEKVFATPAYRLEKVTSYDASPAADADIPANALISAAGAALTRDTADDPFFPRRGSRASVSGERAGDFLGGNVHFNKLSASWAAYAPVPGARRLTAAFRAHAGAAWPLSPSEDLPIFERFFTGGANSVRGYRERGVGPLQEDGSPLGGNRSTGASAELRFPLWKKLSGAAFLDGGMVGGRAADVRPRRWAKGAGAGLRLATPVGPLRVDFAWKLNPRPPGGDPWRVHFSLGEAF